MLRSYKDPIAILTLLLAISGCTSTEMHTFKNEELVGKYYDRILLVVDIPNANDRFTTEIKFQQEFAGRGLDLLLASVVIPNLSSLSERQLFEKMNKESINSVLILTPAAAMDLLADRDETPRYKSKRLQWANDLLYFDNPNPVYPEGEDLYTGIYGKFSLKLIDFQTGKVAWLGISLTERDGLGDFECLITDNAKQTVQTLTTEKLIVPVIAGD